MQPNRYDSLKQLLLGKEKHTEPTVPNHTSSAFQFLSTLRSNEPTQPLPQHLDDIDFNPFWGFDDAQDDVFSYPELSSSALFEKLHCCEDHGMYLPDDDGMCSVYEAFENRWEREDLEVLMAAENTAVKSPSELMDEVRPIMTKQELANAYHNMALLMAKKLPLISLEHQLFHRHGAVYDPIDASDLYDLLCKITDKSIHGGIKKRGREELYSSVASIRSIQISADDVAKNPNLIPLLDKVYDVETGRCHEPRSNEIFFSCINLTSEEIGIGDGRLLERFLETSFGGDQQVIERFLQVQGVILSPYTPKAIFHYYGPHDTGKSEAVRLISLFLHPQSRYIHSVDDPNKLTERFGLAPLSGKRLLLCPDASKIAFKEPTCAILKQLAGGRDLIGTDDKNRPHFTFVNEAKPLFLSNHLLRGDFDEAFLSRLVTVPFHQTIPPEQRIPHLAEKIFASRGYFFLAAMQALRRLIDRNFVFTPVDCPPSYLISDAGTGSVASISDSIYAFVDNCCTLDPDMFSSSQNLFETYQRFCADHHLSPIQQKPVFGRTLHAAFPEISEKRTSSYRGFEGIGLLNRTDHA